MRMRTVCATLSRNVRNV